MSDSLFTSNFSNTRIMVNLLKTIDFCDRLVMKINEDGVVFSVESFKSLQANIYVPKKSFHGWILNVEFIQFSMNIQTFIQSLVLMMYNDNNKSNVSFKFHKYGYPFEISCFDEHSNTTCSIDTYDASNLIDFSTFTDNIVAKLMIKSFLIKETLQDIDQSSELFDVTISNTEPNLQISSSGTLGVYCTEFCQSGKAFEMFVCETNKIQNRYKTIFLKPIHKAANMSTILSIKIDKTGLISFQFMIDNESNEVFIVEYMCLPQ